MLFDFDHDRKMVSNTITLGDDQQSVPIPETFQEAVHITKGETALVLISDGTVSGLYTDPVVNTASPHVPLEEEFLQTLGLSNGDEITYWVTLPNRLDEISLTEGTLSFDGQVTGTESDPTDGTWLLIADREFGYSESSDRVKSEVTIFKNPYRKHLQYDGGAEFTVKVVHDDNEVSTDVSVYSNRRGFTVTQQVLDDLGITKTERSMTAWVDTTSVAETKTARATTDGSGVKNSTDTNTDDNPTSDQATPESPETTSRPETTSGSEPDSTVEDTAEEPQSSGVLDIEPDITANVNPDIMPAILLDDDERMKEDWQAHYVDDDGELLCGKSYTDYVKDPEGDHYTDVCEECALVKPGSLPARDLSMLLESETGLSFTEELPFVIDRRDAAKLFVQLIQD